MRGLHTGNEGPVGEESPYNDFEEGMRRAQIIYNPSLSVEENAKVNGCSVANIRYHIKTIGTSRRSERKQNIVDRCRNEIDTNPSVTDSNGAVIWDRLHEATGYSLSTIRKYRENILSGNNIIADDEMGVIRRMGIPDDVYTNPDIVPLSGTIGINGTAYSVSTVRDIIMILRVCGREAKKANEPGAVYFGFSDSVPGAVKIGSTQWAGAARRQNQLSTSFRGFFIKKMVKTPDRKSATLLEDELHKRFERYSVGCEWFSIPQRMLDELYDEIGAVSKD